MPPASLQGCAVHRVCNFGGWDVEAAWFSGRLAASSVSRPYYCRPVADLERMRVTIQKGVCHHCGIKADTLSGEGKGRSDDIELRSPSYLIA